MRVYRRRPWHISTYQERSKRAPARRREDVTCARQIQFYFHPARAKRFSQRRVLLRKLLWPLVRGETTRDRLLRRPINMRTPAVPSSSTCAPFKSPGWWWFVWYSWDGTVLLRARYKSVTTVSCTSQKRQKNYGYLGKSEEYIFSYIIFWRKTLKSLSK